MSSIHIKNQFKQEVGRQGLIDHYRRIRDKSEKICLPLRVDDYQIQSIMETSPPKWHLAHVTWFFETFVLKDFVPGYLPWNAKYNYLFNSYYQTIGDMHARTNRDVLSRPTVEEIYQYRFDIDEQMVNLFAKLDESQWQKIVPRILLGLNHEQQHQELLYMDIKGIYFHQSPRPLFSTPQLVKKIKPVTHKKYQSFYGGVVSIGHRDHSFSFDNEIPEHKHYLEPFRLRTTLVSNAEYLEFIHAGGYQNPELWLSDGWDCRYSFQKENCPHQCLQPECRLV